ncbi:MAG: hypothetical protein QXL94_01840, partial [Candidatus Parvarchaeum sp.]
VMNNITINSIKYLSPFMKVVIYKGLDKKIFDKNYDVRYSTPRDVLNDIVETTGYNPGINEVIKSISNPITSNRLYP